MTNTTEEVLDIVNEDDNVIGNAPRSEIYSKKHIHRIVHVLIFNKKNKMVLQLRSKQKSFMPNAWVTSAGGHVQSGEDYETAAKRELKEELGISPSLELLYKDFYEDNKGLKKFLTTFKAVHEGPFVLIEDDVKDARFFSLKQIQEMINNKELFHPELLFLLRNHYNIK